jgi:hypothetical protein
MPILPALGRCGLASLGVVLGSCGDGDPARPTPLATGIEVVNQTSGDPIELDGYTVSVDAAPLRALAVNASVVFPDLEPGDHSVELAGMEPGCTVLGANPRTVHTTGGTATSLFLVRCSAPGTGRIVVQTYTSGDDAARYLVELDGGQFAELGAKDVVTFYAVPAGPVTLTLSGEGTGGNVIAPNPRTVQVRVGEQQFSRFKIYCTE